MLDISAADRKQILELIAAHQHFQMYVKCLKTLTITFIKRTVNIVFFSSTVFYCLTRDWNVEIHDLCSIRSWKNKK